MQELIRGIVYLPDNETLQELQDDIAYNVGYISTFVKKSISDGRLLEIYNKNCENEIIVDGVLSSIIGDLDDEPRNFIIPENLVDPALWNILDKIDIGKGIRERARVYMSELNHDYINPDKLNKIKKVV